MYTKRQLLDAAEVIDAWRVWPRFMLTMFLIFLWDVHEASKAGDVSEWYASLVYGALAVLTKFYLDSGRVWTHSESQGDD
jgi:hypothetical protein